MNGGMLYQFENDDIGVVGWTIGTHPESQCIEWLIMSPSADGLTVSETT
jgi:hypothetical protein